MCTMVARKSARGTSIDKMLSPEVGRVIVLSVAIFVVNNVIYVRPPTAKRMSDESVCTKLSLFASAFVLFPSM